MRNIKVFAVLGVLWGVVGCVVSSGERIQNLASKNNYASSIEQSAGFSQLVFSNQQPLAENKSVNIYLEGDGVPWQFRYFVSPDPTPRNPLMLDLMALDKHSAFYVGRPCYNGFSEEAPCEPKYWTSSRHAKVLVDSMSGTISRLVDQSGALAVNLFGFSGGGAMAMLLAGQLSNTKTVVTLAGNLDLKAWTSLHGYSPLYGSLDPATQPLLSASIKQIHLMGEKDTNIPSTISLKQVQRQKNSDYYVFDNFRHSGPWREVWPRVLMLVAGNKITAVQKYDGEGSLAPIFSP